MLSEVRGEPGGVPVCEVTKGQRFDVFESGVHRQRRRPNRVVGERTGFGFRAKIDVSLIEHDIPEVLRGLRTEQNT